MNAQKPEDIQSQIIYNGLLSLCCSGWEDSVGGSGNWLESSWRVFSLTGDLNCKVTGRDRSCGDYFVLFTETEVFVDRHTLKFWMLGRDSLGNSFGPAFFKKWCIMRSTVISTIKWVITHDKSVDAWLLTLSYNYKIREHLNCEGCLLPVCFSVFLLINFHLQLNSSFYHTLRIYMLY